MMEWMHMKGHGFNSFSLHMLVGIIIILGNRYPWAARLFGTNPVAVLATLFLLSYAKLLNVLIAALSFTFLNYPDGSDVAVWLYNGNIGYLKGKHIPLLMAALLVIIIPYGGQEGHHNSSHTFSSLGTVDSGQIRDANFLMDQ